MTGDTSLFRGRLVRLAAHDPNDVHTIVRWTDNGEYMRRIDTDPARPLTVEEVAERYGRSDPYHFYFGLRTLADDRLIGFVALHSIEWTNGAATFSMGIGDPADWGQGYGSDAINLIMRYAFAELNLHRVGVEMIATNASIIRLIERAGFQHEGRMREAVHRDGSRVDLLLMGLLRRDWEAAQAQDG